MYHNSKGSKVHKVHSSHMKRSRDKQRTHRDSFSRHNHHSVSDAKTDSSPIKIKLKIKVTEGRVEVVNTATSEQRSSLKSSISPKPLKPPSIQFAKPKRPQEREFPKKPEKDYLNVRIPQEVALANEAVHCGIADSVKTKKRKCKDKTNSSYSSERSYSPELPMLMLSPKRRRSRKKTENNVPTKQSKSNTSYHQSSYVLDKRKNFDTFRELFVQPEDSMCFTSPSKQYNEQGSSLSPGTSNELYNQPIKKSPDTLKELYRRIEPTSSTLPNHTLVPKIEVVDPTPVELYNEQDNFKNLGNSFEQVLNSSDSLTQLYNKVEPTSSNILIPAPIPKKDIVDIPLPFDIISDIERWFKCNTKDYVVDEVESTVMDPTFENAKKKFNESAASFVREYLDDGFPDTSEIGKTYFDTVITSQVTSDQPASLENVFQSCASSPELVISSYEDAEEIEVEEKPIMIPSCMESPPYGSQESGYSSMSSPFSDDTEYQSSTDCKHKEKPDRPLRLTDIQFLKMCHSYAKTSASSKWSAKNSVTSNNVISIKKFGNGHSSKMSFQIPKINKNPNSTKQPQLAKIKIIANKCVPCEEPRKEFSPRSNEHAKALHERRVVYLGNIPSTYTVHYLREKFKRFGEIEYIQIKSKECDEIDKLDHRYLTSQPLRGRGSNPGKGHFQKERLMKHFGFVTFKKTSAAREVFERRKDLCTWPGGSINYGGRREFVKEEYADFDAEANNLTPGCSFKQNQENEVDYTQLLKKEQEKRGLIASPNFKRTQHSQHV